MYMLNNLEENRRVCCATLFIGFNKYFSSIDDDMAFEFVWSAFLFQCLHSEWTNPYQQKLH